MASEITLRVATNDIEVLQSLATIENAADELSKKQYKLNFDVSGLSQKATATINAIARLTKAQAAYNESLQAEARVKAANTKADAQLITAKEKLAVETQKQANEEVKLAKQQEATRTAAEKRATAETNLANTQEKRAMAEEKAARQTEDNRKKTEEMAKAASSAEKSVAALGSALQRFAIRELKKAFSEALDTMREVDQEMINIRKVSDYSTEDLQRIQSRSYDVANRYGIGVTDYLASVAQWAKAGYGNADELAELSTKLQLVGDVNSEVASKMLLSADAAWKFGGSVTDLNHVIDAANIIENNFATSIDKLAEGFPIVASTASMVGMSVDQTLAAIGTISAATQESGRKSATALRSLLLNLMKEVGTFEDGVEVTSESVSKLYLMLEKYEPEALAAAEATGKIVDPMAAVSALAQAAADGFMTEAEMANYLAGIGGKLRVNQLVSLIKNQETYNSMLEKAGDAAGSADKEVSTMMESWNARIKKLKNTWTEFVANLVDTSLIKKGIDFATSMVESLNGMLALLKGDATSAGFYKGYWYLWQDSGEETFGEFKQAFEEWKSIAEENPDIDFETYLEAWKQVHGVIKETTAATVENTEAANENADAQNKTAQAIDSVTAALQLAQKEKSAFDEAMKAGEKDDLFKGYADAFKTLSDEIAAGRVNSNAFWASAEFLFGEETLARMGYDAATIAEHAKEIAPMFDKATDNGKGLLEILSQSADEMGFVRDEAGNVIATIRGDKESGWDWIIQDADAVAEKFGVDVQMIEAAQQALRVYSDVAVTTGKEATDAADETRSGLEGVADTAGEVKDGLEGVADTAGGIRDVTGAIDEFSVALEIAANKAGKLARHLSGIGPGGSRYWGDNGMLGDFTGYNMFASGTSGAPGGPSLVNEVGPELISDRGRAYVANGGAPAVVNLSRGAVVFTAQQTKSILGSGRGYNGMPAHKDGKDRNFANFVESLATNNTNHTPGDNKNGGDGGNAGGNVGGASSSADMKSVQEALDALLKNLKLQADLAKNEGRIADMNALYKRAQDEIQKVVDQYLAEGYEETSDEVLTLKNLIYDYAGKMQDMEEAAWKDVTSGLKDVLSSINEKAELEKNRGNFGGVNDLYQQAQNEIQKVIDQYLAAGYAADSDEVVKLKNQIYDYAGKMHDLAAESWKALEDALDKALDTIDGQIDLAQNKGDTQKILMLYQQAQNEIANLLNQYLAAGYAPDSDEVVALANKGYSYAGKQQSLINDLWKNLTDAIQGLKDATDDANDIAEKQLAVDEATLAYANAQKQRTVRIFNPASGQWEWVADEAAIQNAQASLQSAQKNLSNAEFSRMLEMLRNGEVGLDELLTSGPLSSQYNAAGGDARAAFLSAIGAYYGGVNRAGSTAANSAFSSSDSHDTNYNVGGVSISREQAESMTLAQLADYLSYAGIAS